MSATDHHSEIVKSDAEWRAQLTPEQFYVTRKHGTERAFTGPYWNEKARGKYTCVCCGEPLFSSATKFDSGTGWPSFYAPLDDRGVGEHEDRSWFMRRTEVRCAELRRAPRPRLSRTGRSPPAQRYCINGCALDFAARPDKA